jgi:hypothetical protein
MRVFACLPKRARRRHLVQRNIPIWRYKVQCLFSSHRIAAFAYICCLKHNLLDNYSRLRILPFVQVRPVALDCLCLQIVGKPFREAKVFVKPPLRLRRKWTSVPNVRPSSVRDPQAAQVERLARTLKTVCLVMAAVTP